MPTKVLYPSAFGQGFRDFLVSWGATKKQADAINKQYKAQADAQLNSSLAEGVSKLASAGIGAYTAHTLAANPNAGEAVASDAATGRPIDAQGGFTTGLSPLEKYGLASSFAPGLEGPSRAAQALGAQQREFNQRTQLSEQAYNQASALADERSGNRMYEDAYANYQNMVLGASAGRVPPAPVVTGGPSGAAPSGGPEANMSLASGGEAYVSPSGQVTQAPPQLSGGVPLPVLDPTTIPMYNRAREKVTELTNRIEATRDKTIPRAQAAYELADLTRQLAPQLEVLKAYRQPPPPTTEEQLKASGAVIEGKDGTKYIRNAKGGYDVKAGPKTSPYQKFVETATAMNMQNGMEPIAAASDARRQWMVIQAGGQANYDAAVATGRIAYLEEDKLKWLEPLRAAQDPWTTAYMNAIEAQAKQQGSVTESGIAGARKAADAVVEQKQYAQDVSKLRESIKSAVAQPPMEGIDEVEFASLMREIGRLYETQDDVPKDIKRWVEQLDARLHPTGTASLLMGPR